LPKILYIDSSLERVPYTVLMNMTIERFVKYLQFEKRYSSHTVVAYEN